MAKLIYRTCPPKKGRYSHTGVVTHDLDGFGDKPSEEIQRKAMELVNDSLLDLILKLDELGYDPTKVRFQIYYKIDRNTVEE